MSAAQPKIHALSTEDAARRALEEQYGRPLSEREWRQAREDLLAFIRLLREWHQTLH